MAHSGAVCCMNIWMSEVNGTVELNIRSIKYNRIKIKTKLVVLSWDVKEKCFWERSGLYRFPVSLAGGHDSRDTCLLPTPMSGDRALAQWLFLYYQLRDWGDSECFSSVMCILGLPLWWPAKQLWVWHGVLAACQRGKLPARARAVSAFPGLAIAVALQKLHAKGN